MSKFHPKEAVLAAIKAGLRSFGENRIAELAEKKTAVAEALAAAAPTPAAATDTTTPARTPVTSAPPATASSPARPTPPAVPPHPATSSASAASGADTPHPAASSAATPHPGIPLRWELIGHLQSNKARLAVAHADRIQSVDSVKLLQRLSALCVELKRPQLPVLLQINAGNDPAKFGVDLSDAPELLEAALCLPHIAVEGLMAIAPLCDDPTEAAEAARECFTNLRQLRDALQTTHKVSLPVLSMGMTNDLEEAIRAGSTQLRIGTALFGTREN